MGDIIIHIFFLDEMSLSHSGSWWQQKEEAVQLVLERHKEVLKVGRSKFNKRMWPEAYVREEVEELTLRAGEAVTHQAFIDTTNMRQHMEATARERRQARGTPRHLHGRRVDGVYKFEKQISTHEQRSRRPESRRPNKVWRCA